MLMPYGKVMLNKEVAKKYGIPKPTFSTWVKTYKWYLSKWCESFPLTGLIVQTQALEFTKKLTLPTFKDQMDRSEIGIKGNLVILRSEIGKFFWWWFEF